MSKFKVTMDIMPEGVYNRTATVVEAETLDAAVSDVMDELEMDDDVLKYSLIAVEITEQ